MRAHLHGGVPLAEIDAGAMRRFWSNYAGLRESCFVPRAPVAHGAAYADFSPALTDLRAIADGKISVTPLHIDLTHMSSVHDLKKVLGGAPPKTVERPS